MEEDQIADEVELQLMQLQDTLKERLKQTEDLGDLTNDVFKSSLEIEEHTEELKNTAVKTKWKWLYEYMKWIILGGAILTVLLLILLKMIFGK